MIDKIVYKYEKQSFLAVVINLLKESGTSTLRNGFKGAGSHHKSVDF